MDLYNKYRPGDFSKCLDTSRAFREVEKLLERRALPHGLIFYGPSGLGKTTLARILAERIKSSYQEEEKVDFTYEEINAGAEGGVAKAREVAETMMEDTSVFGKVVKVYCLDEAQSLNKPAQRAYLKPIEDNQQHVYVIFSTTEPEALLPEIRTRCTSYKFYYPEREQLLEYLAGIYKEECPEDAVPSEALSETDLVPDLGSISVISIRSAMMRLQSFIYTGGFSESHTDCEPFMKRFKQAMGRYIKKASSPSYNPVAVACELYEIAVGAGMDAFRNAVLYYCQSAMLRNPSMLLGSIYIGVLTIMKPYLVAPHSADMLSRLFEIATMLRDVVSKHASDI
jgi:replication-associated recombination protein RarA